MISQTKWFERIIRSKSTTLKYLRTCSKNGKAFPDQADSGETEAKLEVKCDQAVAPSTSINLHQPTRRVCDKSSLPT